MQRHKHKRIESTDTDNVTHALCLMSCRGTDGEKAVLQAIDTALARASQVEPAFAPANKKKGSIVDESYELQRSAFMAARAALKGDTAHLCNLIT